MREIGVGAHRIQLFIKFEFVRMLELDFKNQLSLKV